MPNRRAITARADQAPPRAVADTRPSRLPRFNAARHGILAPNLLAGESQGFESAAELRRLQDQLRAELAPAGIVEEILVERILTAYWRLRRVLIHEQIGIIRRTGQLADQYTDTRTLLARLEHTISRAPGPAVDPDDPAERDARELDQYAAAAAALVPPADTSDELVRYENALERQLYRAIRELRDLQRARLAHAANVPTPAAQPAPLAIHVARVELQPAPPAGPLDADATPPPHHGEK